MLFVYSIGAMNIFRMEPFRDCNHGPIAAQSVFGNSQDIKA
jgi:hypothetical protein